MKETLKYKGFIGSVEFSKEDIVLHGELLFITDLITYEAESAPNLIIEFEAAVDDYIQTCKILEREPLKPCSGTFNIRIDPNQHRQLATYAVLNNRTVNDLIKESVSMFLENPKQQQVVHNHNYYQASPTFAISEKIMFDPTNRSQETGGRYDSALQ